MASRSSQLTIPRWFWPTGTFSLEAIARSRWTALTVLTCAIVLLRVPFQLSVLDHWDSVQYALGLDHFDVAAHMPHPPGSPFYILLGRLFVLISGSVRTSFFLISVVASLAATFIVFGFTDRLFGRMAAWIAALVLVTEPPFWYYGAAGNSWTILAALSALNGLCCWRVLKRAPHALPAAALILGLSSGFRLDVTVFMAPLWAWCAWRTRAPFVQVLLGFVIIGLSVAAWLVPVVLITPGGLALWLERYIELFKPESTSTFDALRTILRNTAVIWTYVGVTLAPLAVAGALLTVRSWRSPARAHWDLVIFFALWAVPSFVCLWVLDTTEAGHYFLFTVAMLPALAALVARAPRAPRLKLTVAVAVLMFQTAAFLATGPVTDRFWGQILNPTLTGYTAEALRQRELAITGTLSYVRNTQDPKTSVITTVYGETPYRFIMYYLPEYSVIRVREPEGFIRVARNRTTAIVFKPPCVDASVASTVWVTDALQRPDYVPPNAARVIPADGGPSLWRVYADDPTHEDEPLPGIRRCSPEDSSTTADQAQTLQ